ncbi:hypothetical protein SK128_009957 [Halocaridina rubra]|uniref:Uncharacterized protein n=1 Tax=Halocaridina rubra TaxID=373956 RepID=A0AAN8W9M5_HALRR
MILALRSAAKLRTNQQKSFPEQVRLWVKGCFSLNCVLGTTWVFGFLYINTSHVFAYIFTILNASQGLMILVLHCFINDTVRKAIIKSLPTSVAKRLKKQNMIARRQTVAAVDGRSTSPRVSPSATTLNSLTTTPSSSPEGTPPTAPLQRRASGEMERVRGSHLVKRSPQMPNAMNVFPYTNHSMLHGESNVYNIGPTTVEVLIPRIHQSLRNGSQLSNSTQSTFLSGMKSNDHFSISVSRLNNANQ